MATVNAPRENQDSAPHEKQPPAVKDLLGGLREAVNDPMQYVQLLIKSLTDKLAATKEIKTSGVREEEQKRTEVAIIERRLELAEAMV